MIESKVQHGDSVLASVEHAGGVASVHDGRRVPLRGNRLVEASVEAAMFYGSGVEPGLLPFFDLKPRVSRSARRGAEVKQIHGALGARRGQKSEVKFEGVVLF